MNFDYFTNVPEDVDEKALAEYLAEFVRYANKKEMNRAKAAKILAHLAELQWNTYEVINDETKGIVSRWIAKYWDRESEDSTDYILSVISYLGLKESLDFMKSNLDSIDNKNVGSLINDALEEIGENVDDPYFGMTKGNSSPA